MDKKLKIAADKIKMPEDMKARIINACEAAEKKRPDTSDLIPGEGPLGVSAPGSGLFYIIC